VAYEEVDLQLDFPVDLAVDAGVVDDHVHAAKEVDTLFKGALL
jgi:hypothetical protein